MIHHESRIASSSWAIATVIATDAQSPQVAIAASGNALAVWQRDDGTHSNIWANRYDPTSASWGTATVIESDDAGNAEAPHVVIDNAGNGIAVWRQDDGTRYNIWANRYE